MPKECFRYPETTPLLETLDGAARQSGLSRGQTFDDFLQMTVCALSGGQMESQYLAVVKKYTEGKSGQRGCDRLARLLGQLVEAMESTAQQTRDILGDLFEGAITYGEHGQYLTPEPLTHLMANLALAETKPPEPPKPRTVCDPCCGSGRLLLAVAEERRHWEFIGQDVDLRCVRMTAINLALRNLYGYVVWGNSLALEQKLIYRTGFNLQGFVRKLPLAACPAAVQQVAAESQTPTTTSGDSSVAPPTHQLRLF